MIACEVDTASVLIVNVAASVVPPLRLPVPMELPPSSNVTMPVGVPAPRPAAATVAVNVTLCPNTDGLLDELLVVLVPAWLTVCVTVVAEVLVVKLLLPW